MHPTPYGYTQVLRRLLFAALALMFALAGLTPAAASPHEDVTIEYHYMDAVPQQVTICTHDKVVFDVQTTLEVRRFSSVSQVLGAMLGGGRAGQYSTFTAVGGQNLDGISANRNIGDISPRGTYTSLGTSIPSRAHFTFTSKDQPGHTQATFSQPAASGPYGDVTVDIEVKRCKYRIEVKSEWDFGWGWQPHAIERLQVEVTPDQNGEFDVLAPVLNQAEFTLPPPPFCSTDANGFGSKARVKGKATDGDLTFRVEYDPVPGDALVACRFPMGGGQASNQDQGLPKNITTRPLEVSLRTNIQRPVFTGMAHEAEANGTWWGTAVIKVTTIPQ